MRKRFIYKRNRTSGVIRFLTFVTTLAIFLFLILTYVSFTHAQLKTIHSPDGQYKAKLVGKLPDLHYQVKDVKTNKVLLTTHAQYSTANDVKAGLFSPDSKKFAAAYHYSGPYTWVGVWEIKTGKLLDSEKKSGFLYDIAWIYKKTSSNLSPDGRYRASLVGTLPDLHYQVKVIKTDSVLFTTHAQYPRANDVKAKLFSPDSKEFAAAYHYSHNGEYTWIGIWNIEASKLDRSVVEEDFIEIIPDHVFNK